MQIKDLQSKRVLRSVLLVLLLSTVGMTNSYAVIIGDLNYYLDNNTLTAKVKGHKDGTNATGSLTIPSSVTYTNYEWINGQQVPVTRTYTVTEIDDEAFYNCSGLTGSLTIPNSVTCIFNRAFYNCIGFTGSLTIPNSVTHIFNRAFYNCTGFTGSLTIPNSVTYIAAHAFEGCSGLTGDLTIGNSVTEIGDDAFLGCGFSGTLTIGESLHEYRDLYNGSWVYLKQFSQIVVASGNTMFDSRGNCNAIIETSTNTLLIGCNNTTIPNSVTTIGNSALSYCTGLNSITIPNSVTSIGYDAFEDCLGLTGSLTIPNSVTIIEDRAFSNCSGFTGVLTIGNSVTTIGSHAFYNCSGFTEVHFNAINCECSSEYILDYPFTNCGGTLVIGDNVEQIGCHMFDGMFGSNFTGNLIIPNSVTSIGEYAFYECNGFTSLTIGNSVTTIGNAAFRNCSGFTSLTIGNSVTTIGNSAFSGCSSLTSIEIPNSVTSIGRNAFRYCQNLTSITSLAENPPVLGNNVFSSGNHDIPVTVPCGTSSAYQNTNGWNEFTNIQEDCSGTYEIIATANPDIGGTVSGAGSYDWPATATLTATANQGYTFVNWTENDEQVSMDTVYSFVVTEDRTLVANFTDTPMYRFVSATVNPAEGGEVIGEDLYLQGQTATLTAIPNEGYAFINWTEYGIPISTNPTLSFPVTEDVFLVANFGPACNIVFQLNDSYGDGWTGNYLVVTDGNGVSQQLTIGNGSTATYSLPFLTGSHLTLTWIAGSYISECSFTVSYENGVVIYQGTNLNSSFSYFSYGFDVDCNAVPTYYTVTTTPSPSNGGTVSGGGTYVYTDICTLVASPNDGYYFLNWMSSTGEILSTNPTFSFSVTEDINFVANFIVESSVCYVTFNLVDSYGDGWTGNYLVVTDGNGFSQALTIVDGSTATYTLPFLLGSHLTLTWMTGSYIEDCSFSMSYEDGSVIYQGANLISSFFYEFDVNCSGAAPNYYNVTASANPTIGGTVTGAGTYMEGSLCTLTATPNEGYIFTNWTKNGTVVSTNMNISFMVAENAGFIANFIEYNPGNIVTQTIELSQGWNWFSTYLEITLDDLKTALLEALPGTAISIKSQTQNTSYNPINNRWVGSLAWDVAKMYMIKVVAPCEITFEGLPINLSEHPVSILNGANWIGFPLNSSMTLSNAFAGFAINGDRIKSQTNNALYNGIRWQGQLNTLEPNKGYIYISNSSDDRIFTFPTNAK